jgi:hypothetical protein
MSQKPRKGFKDLEKIRILSRAEREAFKVPRRDGQPAAATAALYLGKLSLEEDFISPKRLGGIAKGLLWLSSHEIFILLE